MSRIKPWALEELGAGVVWRLQMTYFTEKARWQFFAQEFFSGKPSKASGLSMLAASWA